MRIDENMYLEYEYMSICIDSLMTAPTAARQTIGIVNGSTKTVPHINYLDPSFRYLVLRVSYYVYASMHSDSIGRLYCCCILSSCVACGMRNARNGTVRYALQIFRPLKRWTSEHGLTFFAVFHYRHLSLNIK